MPVKSLPDERQRVQDGLIIDNRIYSLPAFAVCSFYLKLFSDMLLSALVGKDMYGIVPVISGLLNEGKKDIGFSLFLLRGIFGL